MKDNNQKNDADKPSDATTAVEEVKEAPARETKEAPKEAEE